MRKLGLGSETVQSYMLKRLVLKGVKRALNDVKGLKEGSEIIEDTSISESGNSDSCSCVTCPIITI